MFDINVEKLRFFHYAASFMWLVSYSCRASQRWKASMYHRSLQKGVTQPSRSDCRSFYVATRSAPCFRSRGQPSL